MKQLSLVAAIILFSSIAAMAQTAPEFSMHAEAGIPNVGKIGFGVFLKGEMGLSQNSRLTLQAGFSSFSSHGLPDHKATTTQVVPVLVGYKHLLKGFFLEPQIGYGALNSRVDIGGDYARHSNGAFFWAIGGGYQLNQLIMGIRYQSAVGKAYIGAERKDQFGFTGINLGYQLFK